MREKEKGRNADVRKKGKKDDDDAADASVGSIARCLIIILEVARPLLEIKDQEKKVMVVVIIVENQLGGDDGVELDSWLVGW